MDYQAELPFVADLARRAGDILMDIYDTDFKVEFKGHADPVTEADKRANTFLVDALAERFPNHAVVGEESPDLSDAKQKSHCWYVDPLDGTKEFVAKNGEFAVMIGLSVEGESKLGVVYQPVKDKLYTGVCHSTQKQAHLTVDGNTSPLAVSEKTSTEDLILVVSRSHRSATIEKAMEKLGTQKQIISGSVGLKIGLVAEKVGDAYMLFSHKSCVWDTCGPEAILRGAGGRFSDLRGKPFDYDGQHVSNDHGILACAETCYQEVLSVVGPLAETAGVSP